MKFKALCLAIVFLSLVHYASAQRGMSESIFSLYGRMHGTHKDSVLLFYENNTGQQVFQSRPVYSDRFISTDSLRHPVFATIAFKDQGEKLTDSAIQARSHELFIEPGRIYLTGDIAKIDSLKLSGCKSEDEFVELGKLTAPVKAEMQPLTDRYNREKDPEKAAQLSALFEPFDNRLKTITYQFCLKHPTSYVSLHEMVYYANQLGLDSVKRLFVYFTPEQKQCHDGQLVEEAMKKIDGLQPGHIAPDFTAIYLEGKATTLADYKGKYVLLDFWSSWNSASRLAHTHLVDIYNKYKAKGLSVISIADNDQTIAAWKKAIIQDKTAQWLNTLSGIGTPDDINDKFAVHYLPTKILIDPAGKIIGRFGDNNNVHADVLLDRALAGIFKE